MLIYLISIIKDAAGNVLRIEFIHKKWLPTSSKKKMLSLQNLKSDKNTPGDSNQILHISQQNVPVANKNLKFLWNANK